jgi:hypothetical protein
MKILHHVEQLNAEGRVPPTRLGIGLHIKCVMTGNVGVTERQGVYNHWRRGKPRFAYRASHKATRWTVAGFASYPDANGRRFVCGAGHGIDRVEGSGPTRAIVQTRLKVIAIQMCLPSLYWRTAVARGNPCGRHSERALLDCSPVMKFTRPAVQLALA